MGVKNILKIRSTDELCVDEGSDIHVSSGSSYTSKHVRLIDPVDYQLTDKTRDVELTDLVEYLVWDGSEYVTAP